MLGIVAMFHIAAHKFTKSNRNGYRELAATVFNIAYPVDIFPCPLSPTLGACHRLD